MKKLLLWLADIFHVDLVDVVEISKEVEKVVYVYDGDKVEGDLTVNGNLAVNGNLHVSGGITASGFITSTSGSAKKVIIKSKEI